MDSDVSLDEWLYNSVEGSVTSSYSHGLEAGQGEPDSCQSVHVQLSFIARPQVMACEPTSVGFVEVTGTFGKSRSPRQAL